MSRAPAEIRTTRIGALSRLPAFFALEGKRAVVAGSSRPAAWKAELLSAAGAHIDVFAPVPDEEMRALAAAPPAGAVVVHARHWIPTDFAGAAIAVGDCADDAEAAQFAAAARAAGVPVNVIDRPAFCDFAFGAIVNRSPLVIGISTDGAAPVFGQAIRAKIEALIPKGFARWAAAAARAWRPRVAGAGAAVPRPATFLGELHRPSPSPRPTRAPTEADLEALLAPTHGRARGRLGRARRRRPGRSGAVDAARGARAAIGRRDPVRRSRVAGDPRFRAPRSEENAGRQNRPRAVVPAGRHQRADGVAREGRAARGAAQGRRSDDLRPRRRGDRRLPRRRDRDRRRARRHRRARRGEPAPGVADAPRAGAPGAIHHRP